MSNKKKKLIIFGVIGGMVLLLTIGYLNLYEYGETIKYYAPAWSPDGERVIYFKWIDNWKHVWFMGALGWIDLEDEYYICTIDLEGKDERIIRRVLSDKGAAIIDAYISWNGNTNKIVYSINNTSRHSPKEVQGIYVMNADGTENKKLSDNGKHPDWSPDGKGIVYEERTSHPEERYPYEPRDVFYQNDGIWVMDADGSNKHKIVEMENAHNPVWSPSGELIAFAYTQESDIEGTSIWLVNPDGSGLRELCKGDWPIWYLGNDMIMYCNRLDYGRTYTINIDGTENKRLPDEVSCYESRLSPDGTKFVGGSTTGGGIGISDFDGTNHKQLLEMVF